MKKTTISYKLNLRVFLAVYAPFLCLIQVLSQPTFSPGHDPKQNGEQWVKVENLSDEFEGNRIETSKWHTKPDINSEGWYWIGRAPGLFVENTVSVSGGNLNIEAKKLNSPVYKKGKKFTHAGAIVRSKAACKEGWYYECCMKANQTFMSSTFWMMTKENACPKKLELDVQECVGYIGPNAANWAKNDKWDQIFHSNAFLRKSCTDPKDISRSKLTKLGAKNHSKYFVYGFWWKSPTQLWFYLDGVLQYKIENPYKPFDIDMWLQMAVEIYDWNPVPPNGSGMSGLNWNQRTTKYKWIRTWKIEDAENGQNSVTIANSPSSVSTGESFNVTVNYQSAAQNELVVIVNGPTGTWLTASRKTVSAGRGTATLRVNQPTAWAVANGYKLGVCIRPVGGGFSSNIDYKSTRFNITNRSRSRSADLTLAATGENYVGSSEVNSNVKVFPNPFKNELKVSLDKAHTYNSIEIFDSYGRLLETKVISNSNIDLGSSMENASAGVYFIRLTGETIKTIRVIKQ